jgi:hypothetical protein
MTIKFPTPKDVQYDLVLSHEIDEPWSIFESHFGPLGELPRIPMPSFDCGFLAPPSCFLDSFSIDAFFHPSDADGRATGRSWCVPGGRGS